MTEPITPIFASVKDLTDRGATLTVSDDVAQVILNDAAEHLQTITGPIIAPPAQSTAVIHIGCGARWVQVPQRPLVSIDGVTVDGVTALYRRNGDAIRVNGPGELRITATAGYPAVPADLVSWCCVLASQALATLRDLGALGAGEVSSFGIDDYRKAYKQMESRGAFGLPESVETRLASRFGGAAGVTGVLS